MYPLYEISPWPDRDPQTPCKLPPTKNHINKGNGSTADPRNPTCLFPSDPSSDWFRLFGDFCHNHPLQRSTSSRARRRARVSGVTALFLDNTYVATAHLAGGCGTQASKARRRRTHSTRVSSMLGVKTLTRTFLKISRRSLCVHCL